MVFVLFQRRPPKQPLLLPGAARGIFPRPLRLPFAALRSPPRRPKRFFSSIFLFPLFFLFPHFFFLGVRRPRRYGMIEKTPM